MSNQAFTAAGDAAEVGIISLDMVGMNSLKRAIDVVDDSGVELLIDAWRAEDGYDPSKGGRPATIQPRTVLALMALLTIEAKPLHIQQAVNIITDRANNQVLRALGLPQRHETDYTTYKGRQAWYEKVYRAWNKVKDVVDPNPTLTYRKRLNTDEFDYLVSLANPEETRKRYLRLTMFTNALIAASVRLLPEEYRDAWTGDVAVDGTPVLAAKTGNPRDRKPKRSSDPDAGWYIREGDHNGDKAKSSARKMYWAYEATIVTQTFPARQDNLPQLIVGMAMDKPGHAPADRAMDALQHLIADETVPKGAFIGDRIYYPMSKPEKLQIPLRKAGYKVMGDLVKGQMGLQATYHGAQLIDGSWYFPGMPARWRDASTLFAAGEMDRDELYDIIDRRQAFALQVKKIHEDGSIDFYSPARGKRAKLKVDGIGVDKSLEGATLRKVFARDLTKEDRNSAVFKQTQIRIPVDAAAKHVQTGPSWGTQEWANTYRRGRNTIESRNALLKNGRMGLGDKTRRLVRGFANATLVTALGIVGVNIHLIQKFLHRVVFDLNTNPSDPVPTQPCKRVSDWNTFGNIAPQAPPAAA
ncbi:hypothetical protein ACGLFO_14005, partial [Corynebacterium hesseae]|uniref:hypothetical protein n=1 Tax=Corynebacterium hesseae TaxID=2913502 RepID=UPI00373F65BE